MTKCGFLIMAVVVVAVTFLEVSSLKCWLCSTNATNPAFCDDPFDETSVTRQLKRWTYVECSAPPAQNTSRAACQKKIQWTNDERVVSRSCYVEDINALNDECSRARVPSWVEIEYCQTCITDGCNGKALDPMKL